MKPTQIRWMIRRDMRDVLRIEQECFEFPLDEENFLVCLRQRNCIGMVAEQGNRVVGFMIYELEKTHMHLLNFAVAEKHRRNNIGSEMVGKLVSKLSQQRRTHLTLEVRESNLAAQLFFQANGFRATGVLRDHYDETGESAYQMRYALNETANRVAEFL